MDFSAQQHGAMDAVAEWLAKGDRPVFRLFGFAGTGKTTLAKEFAKSVPGRVAFAAFTGKAAHVLHQKGCPGATTIHSLIYVPKDKSRGRLRKLEQEREELLSKDKEPSPQLLKDIREEHENLKRPAFSLNFDSELLGAPLLVIDECSMVNEQIGEDLLSFNVPILVLGDPAQLPPVRGTGFFTDEDPDIMLTDIHRQAKGDPIIELATSARQMILPDYGTYGDSQVTKDMDQELALGCDQIIVGRNKTRHSFNRRIRELKGRRGVMPVAGDRLVCLRNDHNEGLLNGSIWNVISITDQDNEKIQMHISSDDDSRELGVQAHKAPFLGQDVDYWGQGTAQTFDFGYALTCHKSQGSQWDHVLVYDESATFRNDRWRWLYTAITRAAKRVDVVVRGG